MIIPRTATCPVCRAGAGAPCRERPEGDHLARWLEVIDAGHVSRQAVTVVIGRLVVTGHSAITAPDLAERRKAAADALEAYTAEAERLDVAERALWAARLADMTRHLLDELARAGVA